MATLIDAMSAVAIISCDLPIKISVDLAISYYSDVSMGVISVPLSFFLPCPMADMNFT